MALLLLRLGPLARAAGDPLLLTLQRCRHRLVSLELLLLENLREGDLGRRALHEPAAAEAFLLRAARNLLLLLQNGPQIPHPVLFPAAAVVLRPNTRTRAQKLSQRRLLEAPAANAHTRRPAAPIGLLLRAPPQVFLQNFRERLLRRRAGARARIFSPVGSPSRADDVCLRRRRRGLPLHFQPAPEEEGQIPFPPLSRLDVLGRRAEHFGLLASAGDLARER
mmetsp:Transcript_3694/g.8428  ORF Transcript_3694/g.8428 Transcript_3694/m.8428 type:complete len:222 (-) Transcript_3694:2076-2741(-)